MRLRTSAVVSQNYGCTGTRRAAISFMRRCAFARPETASTHTASLSAAAPLKDVEHGQVHEDTIPQIGAGIRELYRLPLGAVNTPERKINSYSAFRTVEFGRHDFNLVATAPFRGV